MYEAADIEGASKLQKLLYITIPSIKNTIMLMFILNMGSLMGGGLYGSNFTISFLLGNTLNKPTSDILDTYVYTIGVSLGRFSYATAVGLALSIVSLALLLSTNHISRKITGESIL